VRLVQNLTQLDMTKQVELSLTCSLDLYRVISGHMAWVRSVCMEPGNEWFDKVIWHYNGHLSAVYDCSLYSTIQLWMCWSPVRVKDSSARVWDMRTKVNIYALSLHNNIFRKGPGIAPQALHVCHEWTRQKQAVEMPSPE